MDHGGDKKMCEPCDYNNLTKKAVHYCEDCDERYCDECILKHKNKKRFAHHNVVNLKDLVKRMDICMSCKVNCINTKATYMCENCDEYLCGDCIKVHLSLKQQRHHKIKCLSPSWFCTNCQDPGNTVEATNVCTNCEDLLCETCSADHKSMKKTRGHTLTTDIAKYYILKPKRHESSNLPWTGTKEQITDKSDLEEKRNVVFYLREAQGVVEHESLFTCDPCAFNGKKAKVTSYCKDCGECFCIDCLEYHKARTQNNSHHLISMPILCITCKNMKKDVEALTYCLECKEPMCQDCARKHQSMKTSREHRLDKNHLCQSFLKEYDVQQTRSQSQIVRLEQKNEQRRQENPTEFAGKPYYSESRSDSIVLRWKMNRVLTKPERFQILYKESSSDSWKKFDKAEHDEPKLIVNGLKADTFYIFKVKIVNDYTGIDGSMSDESDAIQTKHSSAIGFLQEDVKIKSDIPNISMYRLPIKENISARNISAKTRKFHLGTEGHDTSERTIMMVGATGSGKSTLINGMANYIMGVNFEDPFRFKSVNLEGSESDKEGDQAISQTEWVTCYTLHNSLSDRVNFTVNFIDTPGFGDTRGLEHDKAIVDQVRQLFTSSGEKGVTMIDAVCFILKAPDARLTHTQRYIFESILSLFGNDIKDNICTLITFADGQIPQVLSGIKALDGLPLPVETYFTFNNSALYADNSGKSTKSLAPFFWEMGIQSCERFFEHMNKMQRRSLLLTSEVLRKRAALENTIQILLSELEVGLSKVNLLEQEVEILSRNKKAILANKNFEYDMEIDIQEKIDLSGKSQYTTNCLKCNFTCHENCIYSNDEDKAKCCSMNKDGNCTQCPNGCNWTEHHNTPYIIKWTKGKVKKRYEDMKKKYEEATQKELTQEQVLEEMNQDISMQEQGIHVMMEIIANLNNTLKQIALRPDPLSTEQYIDLLIAGEHREMKSGYEARLAALYKCKTRTKVGETVKTFQNRVETTRRSMKAKDAAYDILESDIPLVGWFKQIFSGKRNRPSHLINITH